MATFKKKDNGIWIVLGLIAVVLLITQTDFLGSLVTTCENNEPISLTEYESYATDINGTYTDVDLIYSDSVGDYVALTRTQIISPEIGTFEILNIQNLTSCADYLDTMLNTYTPEAAANATGAAIVENLRLSGRDVMKFTQPVTPPFNERYYWCNNEDNIPVMSYDLAAYARYFEVFEQCTTQEVNPTENESIVIETDKATGTTTFKTQQTNQDPCASLQCPDGYECSSAGGIAACNEIPQNSSNKNRTATIIGGLAILFAVYWFFEKGPKKGIFVDEQTKRMRRRRRK